MEENTCPKPNCGRPESTSRHHAGKRLSICGNGHSWDQVEIQLQREKAREAKEREGRPNRIDGVRIGIDAERLRHEYEKRFGPI
jgi:hypothetical protein